MIKRREFIAGLGSAAAWPVVTWAQQPNRVRRVGVLMANVESDPEAKARFSGFIQKGTSNNDDFFVELIAGASRP